MAFANLRRLAEQVDWTKIRGVKRRLPVHGDKPAAPRAALIINGKGKVLRMRAMLRLGRDWNQQNAWGRVVDHAPGWDGKGRLVSTAKVFTIRKKKERR